VIVPIAGTLSSLAGFDSLNWAALHRAARFFVALRLAQGCEPD
jgi:hypothetical protein